MCELCSKDPEVKKAEVDDMLFRVGKIREFAYKLERMAYGSIKPHTKEAKEIEDDAKRLIKYFASEWL